MAHHDATENNPVKEILTALVGIVLLLVIIGGIAVFGWLRPAGHHYPAGVDGGTTAETSAVAQAEVK